MQRKGCRYGSHRVLEPRGALPQAALSLDNSLPIYDNELLIEVKSLNLDSASFAQLEAEAQGDEEKIKARIMEIVTQRGKMQNPVTGSGGMLIGTLKERGENYRGPYQLPLGTKVATLVSLTLTPLRIERILALTRERIEVEGYAILFESGLLTPLPEDLPEALCLSALDVAGAPAQTARMVKRGHRVVVIGGSGKAGLMCLVQASRSAGPDGLVIGISRSAEGLRRMEELGCAQKLIMANACQPLEVFQKVQEATGGLLAHVVINTANCPGTEMASILSCSEEGTVYFFNMATSFTAAALGAEGIGKSVTMLIGNGYCPGHAQLTLDLVRSHEPLRKLLSLMIKG